MKRVSCLSVLCVCVFATLVEAQVNTERLRQTHDKIGYVTSIGVDLNLLSGNSDKFELAPNGRLDYISDDWNWFLVGTYKYGESAKKVFANKGFVHWRINAPLQGTGFLWEFFTQREFDDFRGITDRTLFGLGVRVPWLSWQERGDLHFGSGLMAEHEVYRSSSSDLVRWTNYVSVRYSDKPVTVLSSVYLQPAVADFSDFRALSDTSLSVTIVGNLSWRVSFKVAYSSRPQPDITGYDLELQNGMTWSF